MNCSTILLHITIHGYMCGIIHTLVSTNKFLVGFAYLVNKVSSVEDSNSIGILIYIFIDIRVVISNSFDELTVM